MSVVVHDTTVPICVPMAKVRAAGAFQVVHSIVGSLVDSSTILWSTLCGE